LGVRDTRIALLRSLVRTKTRASRQGAREVILPMNVIDSMVAWLHPTIHPCHQIATTARVHSKSKTIVLLIEVAVLGALLMLAMGCGAMSPNRAPGLPNEVPLPAHSAFVKQATPGCTTCTGQSWYFTVASAQSQQIASFYVEQLPKRGWREVSCQLYSPEHAHCLARDNHDVLTIMGVSQPLVEITPPRGGVVLAISLLAV